VARGGVDAVLEERGWGEERVGWRRVRKGRRMEEDQNRKYAQPLEQCA
jgi:hypothetical protein